MRKIFYGSFAAFILLLTAVLFTACTCNTKKNLSDYVSELRTDVFEGSSDNFKLKAAYGFKENPAANDGIVGEKVYSLTFVLSGNDILNISRKIFFDCNGKEYSANFVVSAPTDSMTAIIEIDDFCLKSFDVSIITADESENITLKSIIPDNAISANEALTALESRQSALISAYKNDNGEFIGEIVERIMIKSKKAYWYIGLCDGNGGTKALLIDGSNGEILAIREIF